MTQSTQLMRTLLFGLSLTLSMFLMLVFMTYNAYLIFSVLFGKPADYPPTLVSLAEISDTALAVQDTWWATTSSIATLAGRASSLKKTRARHATDQIPFVVLVQ